MASTNIGTWSIKTALDATGITTGINAVTSAATSMMSTFNALGGASFLALEAAIKSYVNAGIDAIKMQGRFTHELGMTADAAAALAAAGKSAGMSAQEMQSTAMMGLRHIGQLREDLAGGGRGGEAGGALRLLGIDPQQFANMRSWADQVALVGDRMRTVDSAADRAAIGTALFGRSWENLLPQMRMGTEGLARMQSLAREFGASVDDNASNSISGLSREMREFRAAQQLAADALRNQFTVGFEGAANSADRLRERLQTLRDVMPTAAAAARRAGGIAGAIQGWWNRQMSAETLGNTPHARGLAFLLGTMEQSDLDQLNAVGRFMHTRVFGRSLTAATPTAADEFGGAGGDYGEDPIDMRMRLRLEADKLTSALERQRMEYGMSREEAERERLSRQGATDDQLAGLDKEIELLRERQRAERESANLMRLQDMSRTPLDTLRARLSDIQAQGNWLNNRERGAALMQALGNMGGGESALLGGLGAHSSETAAILQAAMMPEEDQLATINARLQAMIDQAENTNELWEQIGARIDEIADRLPPVEA